MNREAAVRCLLAAACCGLVAGTSCARCGSVTGVDELARGDVPAGARILVHTTDGRGVMGVFERVADDTLFCRFRSFPVDEVESVGLCEGDAEDIAKVTGSIGSLVLGFMVTVAVLVWFYSGGTASAS